MNKLFPLEKAWLVRENKTASVAGDKWSAGLALRCGERTHGQHKLSSQINVAHRHYSSLRLKGQGSLMVLICGDWLSLLDVITARWRAEEGDSAFPHAGSQRCFSLICKLDAVSLLLSAHCWFLSGHTTSSYMWKCASVSRVVTFTFRCFVWRLTSRVTENG